jgi:hypothetical protein
MRSSAGAYNPELRTPLWLGSVALAALALALLAAFVSVMPRPRFQPARSAPKTTVSAPVLQPTIASVPAPSEKHPQPSMLWPVLLPWAIGLDAVAVLGLILVFVVRSNVRVTVGRGP